MNVLAQTILLIIIAGNTMPSLAVLDTLMRGAAKVTLHQRHRPSIDHKPIRQHTVLPPGVIHPKKIKPNYCLINTVAISATALVTYGLYSMTQVTCNRSEF